VAVQAPTTTRLQILHREADALPVRVIGKHQAQILRERIERSQQEGISDILSRRYGWSEVTRHLDLRLPFEPMSTATQIAEVRCTDTRLRSLSFRPTTIENEDEMQDLRMAEQPDLVLATDGSFELRTGRGACAYVLHDETTARQERHRITYTAIPSAYSAEQDAIFRGLQCVKKLTPRRLMVATDSLSSMERIQSAPEEQADYLLRKQPKELIELGRVVQFVHVRARSGVCLNETADMVATGFLPETGPSVLSQEDDQPAEEPQCATCFDELGTGHGATLACGHSFHRECLQNWTRASANPTCPLCRGPADELAGDSLPEPVGPLLRPDGLMLPMAVEGIGKMLERRAWAELDAQLGRIRHAGQSVAQAARCFEVADGLKLGKLRAPDWVRPVAGRIGARLRAGNCPLLGEYRGRFLGYAFPGCAVCRRAADGRIDHFLRRPGVGLCLRYFEDLSTSEGWPKLAEACRKLRDRPDPAANLSAARLPPPRQRQEAPRIPREILLELRQFLRRVLGDRTPQTARPLEGFPNRFGPTTETAWKGNERKKDDGLSRRFCLTRKNEKSTL